MFHNHETEKITRKASDAAENLQLEQVVQFFHPRSSCRTHWMLFSERPQIYALCIDELGWKNRTTRYNCRLSAASLALRVIFSGRTTRYNRFWRAGCSRLEYVDIRLVY